MMLDIVLALIIVTVLASPLLLIIFCGVYTIYLTWKEIRKEKLIKALKDLQRQNIELTPAQAQFLRVNGERDEVPY